MRQICLALGLVFASAIADRADAAVVEFDITFGGATGQFSAPEAGGLLTAFNITVFGITFDTLGVGSVAPTYDAVANDIRGAASTSGTVLNSAAGGGCTPLECVLDIEDSVDPGVIPGQYAIFPLEMGVPGTVLFGGDYVITPPETGGGGTPDGIIPLPPALALLLGGLGLLVCQGFRKRS
ncbi:MAG: hypothetical protein AAF871_13570 [Pseudomonadota bacterium]